MNQIVKLGKELALIATSITDVYMTDDHYSEVRRQYHAAVDIELDGLDPIDDDFHRILAFRNIVTTTRKPGPPNDIMTVDTDSVTDKLSMLIHNTPYVYSKYIYPVFKNDISNMHDSLDKKLLMNCLKSIMSASSSFRDSAIKLDSYLGTYFTTDDLLSALISYGSLSGLVSWWTDKSVKHR